MEAESIKLTDDKKILQGKVNSFCYNQESFVHNDDKVRFYTGLTSWLVLLTLFQSIESSITSLWHSSLTSFQLLLLTLMRLRLSLSGRNVYCRFGIYPSTFSRIFCNELQVLYRKLKFLIVWPDTFNGLQESLSFMYRLFEIFIDRPSNLQAKAQTYSHYKHKNTLKYLIGVSPQGSICFISKGWGGRVSHKYITEKSGVLSKIIPGDTILADRCFDIQQSIGIYCELV
jgi:hypothetical protein